MVGTTTADKGELRTVSTVDPFGATKEGDFAITANGRGVIDNEDDDGSFPGGVVADEDETELAAATSPGSTEREGIAVVRTTAALVATGTVDVIELGTRTDAGE